MTDKQALKILDNYSKWRKGADIPMPENKEISEALDLIRNGYIGQKKAAEHFQKQMTAALLELTKINS